MSQTSLLFQCLLGMQCKEFTILAADQISTQSIVMMKDDEDKLLEVSNRLLVGVNGDAGDVTQFTQFVSKNMELYKLKNHYDLDTRAAVHFMRKNLSDTLRNGNPLILNSLIGGYDEADGGLLYTMDFLASCVKVPFAAHGFGGYFSFSILQNYHKPTLTLLQAYEVIKLCVHEIHQRLFISLPRFGVKVIDKNGVRTLPTISSSTFVNNKS